MVAQVATTRQYHQLDAQVAARGFAHDLSFGAPICRWVRDEIKLDLMPTDPGILGFHNRWHSLAVETAVWVALPGGITIRLIIAPVFIATKLEAFHGRGENDYLASHDLEDILTVVDGRPELVEEARRERVDLRRYLSEQFSNLLANQDFVQAMPGHLPADGASQAHLPELMRRLKLLVETDRA